MARVSISRAVGFSYHFLATQLWTVLGYVIIPLLLGWGILYASMNTYAGLLERFMSAPNDGTASLALGAAMAGFLVFLFLHAVIAKTIVELAFDASAKFRFRLTRNDWRLYAATLRLLLIIFVWAVLTGGLGWSVRQIMGDTDAGRVAQSVVQLIFVAGAAVIVIRIGFLMAPLVLTERGQVIRRAWHLTRGNFLRIAAIFLLLLIPGLVIQIGGEMILQSAGIIPSAHLPASLADAARAFIGVLPPLITLSAVSYLVGMILLGAGAAFVYRELMPQALPS